jgi:TetR/AcrR family transcriptional regulator, lmrAB and yxaGH operons repressor
VPRTSDARTRAVAAAMRLFQEQGYAATGVAQILDVSGAPKGSFYFHFPGGKEQVAAEALRIAGTEIAEGFRRLAAQTASAAELVTVLIDAQAQALTGSGYRRGCPIATVALEMASESATIRAACQEIFDGWIAVLTDAFSPELGRRRARGYAEQLLMAVEGALLLSRVQRDPRPLHLARDLLISQLRSAS